METPMIPRVDPIESFRDLHLPFEVRDPDRAPTTARDGSPRVGGEVEVGGVPLQGNPSHHRVESNLLSETRSRFRPDPCFLKLCPRQAVEVGGETRWP
eukprot:3537660-Heterocapsa_arctica.AAC.1